MANPSTSAPFGVRLDAATLARLDAYAGRIGRKRGGAAAVALAAGLDALDGLPVTAPPVGHPAPQCNEDVLRRIEAILAKLGDDDLPTTIADVVMYAMHDAVNGSDALRMNSNAFCDESPYRFDSAPFAGMSEDDIARWALGY